MKCEVCGKETTSKYGVCTTTSECRREWGRREWKRWYRENAILHNKKCKKWREEHPEKARAIQRKSQRKYYYDRKEQWKSLSDQERLDEMEAYIRKHYGKSKEEKIGLK